jgi:hypothetical protein
MPYRACQCLQELDKGLQKVEVTSLQGWECTVAPDFVEFVLMLVPNLMRMLHSMTLNIMSTSCFRFKQFLS